MFLPISIGGFFSHCTGLFIYSLPKSWKPANLRRERNCLNGFVSKVDLMMLAASFSMVSQMAAQRTLERWELLSPQSTMRGHSHLAEFRPSSARDGRAHQPIHFYPTLPCCFQLYLYCCYELAHLLQQQSFSSWILLPGRGAKICWQSTQYVYSLD